MSEFGRVLVTGAGGFIGGRVVEMFHVLGLADVRAGVRRWSSAARIGRLPVEIHLCDVLDPQQVETAMKDVQTVIHCAHGPGETNAQGTAMVAAAALKHGVRRFVHISTMDVYGLTTGAIDESSPRTRAGRAYGDSKIAAEEQCEEFGRRGLPYVMLRPTIVYGPFSASWTIEFGERLQVQPWPFHPNDARGTCNLLYVDDLVWAIVLALRAEAAVGQAFNVNGTDRPTWHEYFQALNSALDLPPLRTKSEAGARVHAMAMKPVKDTAKFALRKFERTIRRLHQTSPLAKRVMKGAERVMRKAPTRDEIALYSKQIDVSTEKADRLLGFRARTPMPTGVNLSATWLKANGFIRSPVVMSSSE